MNEKLKELIKKYEDIVKTNRRELKLYPSYQHSMSIEYVNKLLKKFIKDIKETVEK
jgi:hypothetical protein